MDSNFITRILYNAIVSIYTELVELTFYRILFLCAVTILRSVKYAIKRICYVMLSANLYADRVYSEKR